MIKSTLVPLFALLTCILVLPGCQNAPASTDEVFVAIVKVAYAAETDGLAEWTELTGATQPPLGRAARITAPFEGRVESILITDEAARKEVEKGREIVQLDNRLATANESKARAALEEHKQLMEQAKLAVDLAKLEVDRLEKLEKANIQLTNPIEKERARLSFLDAQSKQAVLAEREKSLQADLDTASLQLKLHTLCAPIAGYLGPIMVVPGQTLATGTVVADIIDPSVIDVVAFVPSHTARKLQLNQKARLAVEETKAAASNPSEETFPFLGASTLGTSTIGLLGAPHGNGPLVAVSALILGRAPEGEVIFIAMQASPDTGNFLVKIRFPNKKLDLKANQVVNVRVQTQEPKKRVTIPESAVMEDQDPPRVVVAVEGIDGKGAQAFKARFLTAKLGVRGTVIHRGSPMRVVEILKLEDAEHQEVPVQGAHVIMEGGHGLNEDDLMKFED